MYIYEVKQVLCLDDTFFHLSTVRA